MGQRPLSKEADFFLSTDNEKPKKKPTTRNSLRKIRFFLHLLETFKWINALNEAAFSHPIYGFVFFKFANSEQKMQLLFLGMEIRVNRF